MYVPSPNLDCAIHLQLLSSSSIRLKFFDGPKAYKYALFLCSGYYFTGDGALRDEQNDYRITGRVDDMLNSKGHRLGTAELECAMVRRVTRMLFGI